MATERINKTIYVAGEVYNLATTTAQDIQADVQSRLDAHYGKGCCVFSINVCKQSKEVTINFRRSYNEWYHPENKTNIFCADMDLITGRGIEGFAVPYMWESAPFGYPFSTGIDEFITCYKESAKELGASKMRDIMITHDKDNLNVRLFF